VILAVVALFSMPVATAAAQDRCAHRICTVEEVLDHVLDWDDRTVLVRGWVSGCHHTFDCTIRSIERGGDDDRRATIDFVKMIEPTLGAVDGSEIILRARITDICSGDNICTDRGPTLIPIGIERVVTRRSLPNLKDN
jgi:hypothetical protein